MGRSESAAKDVQRQKRKKRHQKRSLQAGLGWTQQGQRSGMCFKPVEHTAEKSPATAVTRNSFQREPHHTAVGLTGFEQQDRHTRTENENISSLAWRTLL